MDKILTKRNLMIAGAVLVLLVLLFQCGSDDYISQVKNGYLKAFGTDFTIGQILDVINDDNTSWAELELEDARWPKDQFTLIEASWESDNGPIKVQFIVDKDEDNFSLHGLSMNGSFLSAGTSIDIIASAFTDSLNQ